MKRFPKKRGLSKPAVSHRKTTVGARGKVAPAPEPKRGPDNRAKTKVRLDVALVERGLVESREKAARLILAGDVLVDGQRVDKAGALVPPGAELDLVARPRFVSRGGDKLAHALATFAIEPARQGRASTSAPPPAGFTHCLLEQGAREGLRGGRGARTARRQAAGRRPRGGDGEDERP